MKKREDFEGQQMIVLPKMTVELLKNNRFTQDLYITDIGYFPKALYHSRERKEGCNENILIYCLDGIGWIECSGSKSQLKKNQYYIIPKNTRHKYYTSSQQPWTIYWIHFNGNKAERFFENQDFPQTVNLTAESRLEDRIQLFEEIYYNVEKGLHIDNLEYASICLGHLLGSFRYLDQYRRIREVKQQDVVSRAVQFMKKHINHKIKLEEIADACQLSISHFSLVFKKKTQHSPMEYFTYLKMQKACQQLEFTDLKIKQIALQLDYNDALYFTRVFIKTLGMPPTKYRNQKK